MPTLAITGHRVLAEVEKLEAGLDLVARRIEESFPGEEWTVISSLAEGADRLVARRLLRHRGARLLAVLPLPRGEYESDFGSAASLGEFRALLERADEVVEVPSQPSREAAYEAAGALALERAEVLVAVWDGQGAQGQGGTGGVVAEARERGLPLAWVHAGNRRPATMEATSLGEEQGRVSVERFPEPAHEASSA